MTYTAIKIKLYPTEKQKELIGINFSCCRKVWNTLLAELTERNENGSLVLKDEYDFKKGGKLPSRFDLQKKIPPMKKEFPYLKKADSTALQSEATNLRRAFDNWKNPNTKSSFPRFKRWQVNDDTYTTSAVYNKGLGTIRILSRNYIMIPKLKAVNFRCDVPINDHVVNLTVNLTNANEYFASVIVDKDITEFNKTQKSIGIDLGVADMAILSNGKKYETVDYGNQYSKRLRIWERKLARRQAEMKKEIAFNKKNNIEGGRLWFLEFPNYQKARIQVAKYKKKAMLQRQYRLQWISTEIVKQYDVIVIEDLSTKNMLKNHRLAKAISKQGWRILRDMLQYKCDQYSKQLVVVDPYKTSQICPNCDYDDGKHLLNVREWTCPSCGITHDRDVAGAQMILKKGLEKLNK